MPPGRYVHPSSAAIIPTSVAGPVDHRGSVVTAAEEADLQAHLAEQRHAAELVG